MHNTATVRHNSRTADTKPIVRTANQADPPSIVNNEQVLPTVMEQDNADHKKNDASKDGCNSYTNNNNQHHDGDSRTNNNANNADACYKAYKCGYNARMGSRKAYTHRHHGSIGNTHNALLISDDSYGASDNNDSWDNNYEW